MLEILEHGPVREIRMAHPPVNAMNPELLAALTESLRSASASARAMVVSGQPGMFSAGLDIVTLQHFDRTGIARFWGAFFGLLSTVGSSPVPVAFAVTGHSPAGGAVMAIHGDYRVMTRGDFRIGLNEVQVGLAIPRQIQKVLARLVGRYRAERLMVAGALLGPEAALEAGMVDELADNYEETIERAIAWCRQHCALPQHAMTRTRQIARADIASIYDDVSEADLESFSELWFSEETQQTIGRVLERLKKKSA